MNDLAARRCTLLEPTDKPLSEEEVRQYLERLGGWELSEDRHAIHRSFAFQDYYQTMAFVNGVVWIAHHEDHHPHLSVSYDKVVITYSTHVIGGLSLNDMVCAAKVDRLLA